MDALRTRGGALVALLALFATACAGGASDEPGSAPADPGRTELVLAAAATTGPGFDALASGFADTEAGDRWRVVGTYGASADQSRKVAGGMRADMVSFSVAPDMQRLVDAGAVDDRWDDDATGGVPFRSVVVLVVRPGNPLGIHGWDDLLQPGVDVVTPDPRSSGSAMWNMLAPYAAFSDGGADPQAGIDYVRDLVSGHVTARPASARAATDLFLSGEGDVLISYENEAIRIRRGEAGGGSGDDDPGNGDDDADGDDVDYVIPRRDIRIDCPFAVTARSAHPDGARAFMNYLYSPQGQRLWARSGYRPVDPGVADEFRDAFPVPQRLYTIDDLGGWDEVYGDLFAGEDGAITAIYAKATR